jgi:hypothetical protein
MERFQQLQRISVLADICYLCADFIKYRSSEIQNNIPTIMKNQIEVILIASIIAVAGIRIYQKYIRKDTGRNSFIKKDRSRPASSKEEDDYEPYSKK